MSSLVSCSSGLIFHAWSKQVGEEVFCVLMPFKSQGHHCLQALNRKQSSQHQTGPSSGCFPREILLSQESWG